MNQEWQAFQDALGRELGAELAAEYVGKLYDVTGGKIHEAAHRYIRVGKAWHPLLQAWRDWVLSKAQYEPVLVMRDAKPLSALLGLNWRQVWLNRAMCGVPDELSGDIPHTLNPDVVLYLEQLGLDKPFTFVDSGCWGSLVRDLHSRGYNFQPLFFFSHNPAIPGFLNELGIDQKAGEKLNDSLECAFPNVVTRPAEFVVTHGALQPACQTMDRLSCIFGKAALYGVHTATSEEVPPVAALEQLLVLAQQASSGTFTGILPRNSPTWSRGQQFLDTWPQNLRWS
jgi:hypothetical protein